MASSSNRITGLATGLDIDSIIEASLSGQKSKITKKTQEKDILEIKQQLYRDIISEGRSLYDKYFDVTSSGSLLSSTTYKSVQVSSSNENIISATGLSNAVKDNYTVTVSQKAEAAKASLSLADLGITISGDTVSVSDDIQISIGDSESKRVVIKKSEIEAAGANIKSITKLINEKVSSLNIKASNSDFDTSKILIETKATGSNQSFTIVKGSVTSEYFTNDSSSIPSVLELITKDADGNYSSNQDIKVSYNGEDLLIDADVLRSAIGSYSTNYETLESDGKVNTSFIESLKTSLTAQKKKTEDDSEKEAIQAKIDLIDDILEGTEEDGKLTIDSSKASSVKDLILEQAGITMKTSVQSKLTSKFGKNTDGDPNVTVEISGGNISVTGGNIYSGERIPEKIYESDIVDTSDYSGKNLLATFTNSNGDVVSYTEADAIQNNSVTLDGIKYTINGITTDPVTLSCKTDATEIKDKIVSFVNDYNTFIEKLNTLLTEKKYRDYAPLTEDQKKEMSETEIKLWEEKVKSGQLRNDNDLSRIANNMKSAMSGMVSGVSTYLEKIGIKPVADYGGAKSGTYTVDEDALTAALEDDIESVMKLFTQAPNSDATGTDKYNQQGIMYRLKDILYSEFQSSSSSALIQKAGFSGTRYFTQNTISTNISKYETLIDKLQDQLEEKEQNLYSKWATVETIMNNYNSQMSSLSSMFGGSSS